MSFDQFNELQLMEALANEPETSQAALADQLGIAVGTVNWYLKRWTNKGFIKVKRVSRWRWRYLLTPTGMAEKAALTTKYLEASMRLFRQTRQQAQAALAAVKKHGYEAVFIEGEAELAEICRLTCLEAQVETVSSPDPELPTITISALQIDVVWPQNGVQNAS